jgi:hypothetical protein
MDIDSLETAEGRAARMAAAIATGDAGAIYREQRLQEQIEIRQEYERQAKAITDPDELEKLKYETQRKLETGGHVPAETAEGLVDAMQAAIATGDDAIIGREIARQQTIKIRLEHESLIKALKAEQDSLAREIEGVQKKREQMIFLSYSWKDEKLADGIDERFQSAGIYLTRDKRDAEYKQSMKEFMGKVRNSKFVVILLSKNYLESSNCMNEIIEFVKEPDYQERVRDHRHSRWLEEAPLKGAIYSLSTPSKLSCPWSPESSYS